MKFVIRTLVIFAAFSSVNINAQTDLRSSIRTAAAARDHATVISILERTNAEDAELFERNNYDYLLARTAAASGDYALAAQYFQSNVLRRSILSEYSLWHLSQIARVSGNLMLERIYLDEITAFYPYSLLVAAAENRRARSLFDGGNFEPAIVALRSLSNAYANERNARSAERVNLVYLAKAYLRTDDANAARDAASRLVFELPNPSQPDDLAYEGALILDILDKNGLATTPTDLDHLRRAQIYQFNRDYPNARVHFNKIITEFSTSGIAPDAVFQIGLGYAREANYTEAIKWFERAQEQFPDHEVNKEALLNLASAYTRVGKNRESISRYQRYIERYPDGERIDRAYLNIIDILRDDRQETEAVKWAHKIQETFAGKLPATLALFAEARIYLAKDDWAAAIAVLDKLLNIKDLGMPNSPGGTDRSEVMFLRAFSFENLRRFPEAIDAYLAVPDGRNEYYGSRATERLQALAAAETTASHIHAKRQSLSAGKQTKDTLHAQLRLATSEPEGTKLLESLRHIYAELPQYKDLPKFKLLPLGRREPAAHERKMPASGRHKAIADEFLFLGLFDEAIGELDAAQPARSADLDYTLAVFAARGGRADRAASFIEPLWKKPADFQIELIPREVAELLYPAPFADDLVKRSASRSIDPRFLLSIMRQESRFRPNVKSYAAARGLMQFISTTSDKIAGELSLDNFRQDDLYDPSTAILFGAQYTAGLFKIFPNGPQAVAASYNGGEDNMRRWYGRSRSDSPDRYVAEIGFAQSKDYVYKVMANYRMYKALYNNDLMRK